MSDTLREEMPEKLSNINQIRDVIFGAQVREYNTRLEHLESELSGLPQDTRHRLEQLKANLTLELRQSLESLENKLRSYSIAAQEDSNDLKQQIDRLSQRISSSTKNLDTAIDLPSHSPQDEAVLPQPLSSAAAKTTEANADIVALEQLQTLLTSPEQERLGFWIAELEQQLRHIEHQVHDPTALMNLLQPWIAEVLFRKVEESKEEVVRAIAPIIDRVIENRTEQDSVAMSTALAPLMAAAIVQQTQHSPEEVAQAIAPTMGRAMKVQINQEREAIVDALYPILGSMIAKYLAEAIQTINQKLDSALSLEGIQRKIQAKIQGISEAEILLQRAIPFTVQAVFLIHKASGLVIAEVQPGQQGLESEMLSGLLSAIRSFANECIRQSTSDLNEINYGDSKILLEVAGYSYLAAVVRGNPPRSFLQNLQRLMGMIIQQHGSAIEQYKGNPETIPAAVPQMLKTLQPQPLEKVKKRRNLPIPLLVGLLLGLLGVLWGMGQYRDGLDRQVQSATAAALSTTPELAVYQLAVVAHRDKLTLSGRLPNDGLRQKAEQVARSASPGWTLNNTILAVEVPADPTLTLAEVQRTTTLLNQMQGTVITSRFGSGKVSVEGTVTRSSDVQVITQAFERIPGARSVASALRVRQQSVSVRFYFLVGSDQVMLLDLGYKLRQVVEALSRNPTQSMRLTGYSNPIDSAKETQQLSLDRASTVRNLLINQGISSERLQIFGTTQPPSDVKPGQPAWLSRCVEFDLVSPTD